MTVERWKRVKELAQAALSKPPSERSVFVEIACGSDFELRKEVASLLSRADSAETGFLSCEPSRPPQRIGRYEMEKELGSGGMGVVHLARDTVLQRRVAVKSVHTTETDPARRAWFHDRLLREARAAAALSHPNIAALHDVFDEQGVAYIVMEFVDGPSLAARIEGLSPSRVPVHEWLFPLLRQAADGLDYAHQRGIVHRDIKPANLLIDKSGALKIVDFGIAKILDSQTDVSKGLVSGTVEYMSPEQVSAQPLNGQADQFSLAAMAYLMLTGQKMFPGVDSIASLAYKNCYEDPKPASQVQPSLPAAVDQVLARGLAKAASARYPTCREFVGALEFASRAAPAAATVTMAPLVGTPPAHGRRGFWIGAVALVVAGTGGGLVWNSMRPARPGAVKPAMVDEPRAVPPVPMPETPKAEPKPVVPVPPERKKPEPAKPEPVYRGPKSGEAAWTGQLGPGESLVLSPGDPSLSGAFLPGVPVRVQLVPDVFDVTAPPSPANRWKSLSLRNSTGHPVSLILIKWTVVE